MRVFFILNIVITTFIFLVDSAPQQGTEINEQFEESNHTEVETKNAQHVENNAVIEDIIINEPLIIDSKTEISIRSESNDTALIADVDSQKNTEEGFMTKFYIAFKQPIVEFMETPKVSVVLKNIGTCIVNGAMEIVSFYFPAPLIPLIASAAGMVIPFEPIVMLRKRMPVTSYRRAFKAAVNSFMGTFDRFKTSEEDPYMMRSFNRRFMGGDSKGDQD